jgi:integrase
LEQKSCILFHTMQLYDNQGKRLYLTADERRTFIAAAAKAERPVRTFCTILHDTGCRISEALALTPERIDLSGKAVVFESLKKRRQGVYRAVPVPSGLLGMPSTWSTVSGKPRSAARGMPTACSGRGRATPAGGTSKR